MPLRLSLVTSVGSALIAATPVMAQAVRLPAEMVGVWAPDPDGCRDREGEIADSRVEVTATSFETFVSIVSVRRWQRVGSGYRGRGRVAEEGEGAPQPGRVTVELRLSSDGGLWVRTGSAPPERFVRCPAGTRVR